MSAPPKTTLVAGLEEEQRIRDRVRNADPGGLGPFRRAAGDEDAAAVLDLLVDPSVSAPVYDLPQPLTLESVTAWIRDAREQRQRGEGLLILTGAPGGPVTGYSRITIWPGRASAELAGALRAGLQGAGAGGMGAAQTIGWMFDALAVRLVCLTAAIDNVRSIRLIDRMGFRRMGEREAIRPDGTRRQSCYWELTVEEWREIEARRGS